jgi:hypothetical protein
MVGLNKILKYLTTFDLDLVCSKQIYSLTFFVHRLTKDESYKCQFVARILFVFMTINLIACGYNFAELYAHNFLSMKLSNISYK